MQHSYEGLDRGGGLDRVGLLRPLRSRDFRRLWAGMCISLFGDGLFFVALAWEVYALSNVPSALALVGAAMAVPTIAFLLLGGVISDRCDRRRVLVTADVSRAAILAALGTLSVTGSLRLWEIAGLASLYGVATAFFSPAFDAIVPELVPESELGNANALDQFVRPIALRLAGPALGGVIVAACGAGAAFEIDAGTFIASALAVFSVHLRARPAGPAAATVRRDMAEGLAYVRHHTWLWVTLLSAAVAYLLFMGPTEVLVPFIVKNGLHGSAADLGLVFAAGGAGSVVCALLVSQRGLPRHEMVWMYGCWTLATLAIAGYGLAHALWGLMLASLAFNALETVGTIIWATVKQRTVPRSLLGRVSSYDWLISIGLLPLSFALTGPVSGAIGARTTLICAGVLGSAVTAAALLVPEVRTPQGPPRRALPATPVPPLPYQASMSGSAITEFSEASRLRGTPG